MKLLKQEDKRYKIDYSKPVRVYKNLNKGCWSIQQNGLVKAYSDEINLFNCKFLVNAITEISQHDMFYHN